MPHGWNQEKFYDLVSKTFEDNQSKCNCLVNQSELRVNRGKQTVMKFEKTQVIK